ncbi:MAG: hypothetical protein ACXV79_16555 [Methylobacter sp.]
MNNINFGNWQDLDKLQAQAAYQNPHQNAFGGMLRALDPMTYVPGVNAVANPIHDAGDAAVTGINTALSPVVGGAQKLTETITPGLKQFNQATGMDNVDNFVKNKPFDAAALAAATFFSGGAAAEAMTPAAAAAPAAAEGASAGAAGGLSSFGAAGSAAITPAFESGAVAGTGAGAGAAGSTTGALIPASAITPAMASGTYGGIAGAAGTGTLGAAGTAAATSALTPSFATMGGAGYGAIEKARSFMGKAQDAQRYQKSFSNVAEPDTDKINANRQANALAQKILDSNSVPTTNIKRIADRISMNRWG